MKSARRATLVAFLVLAIILVRGLVVRSPKPPRLPPSRPGADLRLCTQVLDGDTIICEGVGKIRLIGIDAPELGFPGGETAAQFLEDRIQGRQVKIEVCPVQPADRYHRTRAIIRLPSSEGEVNINHYLVASGYASVSSLQPCHLDANQWLPLEEEARRQKLGLWALAPRSLSH